MYWSYLLTTLAILGLFFLMAYSKKKKPKLYARGKKISTIWLNMSEKLFYINSIVTLIYLLAPRILEYSIFGYSLSAIMFGISFSTIFAVIMLGIDRYLV